MHLILRNALDGCGDPFALRAAELFFRPQRLTLHDGWLVAADEETVSGLGDRPLSPLVSMLGLPAAAEIDVLNEANVDSSGTGCVRQIFGKAIAMSGKLQYIKSNSA